MILEEVISLAKQNSRAIIESGDEHVPLLMILAPSGVALAQPVIVDKSIFRSVLIEVLMMLNASAYVMINEAWAAKISRDSPLLDRILSGELGVSELPLDDREEILTVTAVDNGRSYRCWTAKINYDHDSRHLGEWEEMPREAEITGRMVLKEW